MAVSEYEPLQPKWLGGLSRFADLREVAAGAVLLTFFGIMYLLDSGPSRTKTGFLLILLGAVVGFKTAMSIICYLIDRADVEGVILGKYDTPPPPPLPPPPSKPPLTPAEQFRRLVKKSGRELKKMPPCYVGITLDLVLKVRCFTLRQMAEGYHNGDEANARKAVKRAMGAGLIYPKTVNVRLIPVGAKPLHVHEPEAPEPDFGALSYHAIKRAEVVPVVSMPVYFATRKARGIFGMPQRKQNYLQCGHDLAVSTVFLRYREDMHATLWQGEDSMPHGSKVPDAMLGASTAIEILGSYDAERIRDFIAFCTEKRLRAELW